jgi:hypothetical protein
MPRPPATLYGHLRGLQAHLRRTADSLDRGGRDDLAAGVTELAVWIERVLREEEERLRAATVPPMYGSREVGA